MAKQIIILERVDLPSDNSYEYLFWIPVPSGREAFYANQNAVSAFTEATSAELTEIQAGRIVEYRSRESYEAKTTTETIQADLQKRYDVVLSTIKDQNRFVLYGTYFDGSQWIPAGKS